MYRPLIRIQQNWKREYQEKALAIQKEIGDRDGEVTSYGDLGI